MARKKVPLDPDKANIKYIPVYTARLFHASDDDVRGIMGPIGSGKSVACVMEIKLRARAQRPKNGVRRTRWAIIRNTYPELISTSMNTWKDWVPEAICPISLASPITGRLQENLPDGTRVDAEIYFLAVDKPDDIKKLKSLELTGAWLNEASELPKDVMDMAFGRTDRFPAKSAGGATWTGVIMDTNPPDDDSWWFKLFEVDKPKGYRLFKQPPAVIPIPKTEPPEYAPNLGHSGYHPAENINNHTRGFRYYLRQVPGKDPEWIKVFLMGQYGTLSSGKPIYPEYSDKLHVAKMILEPYRGLPLILGWDFGLTPALAITQQSPRGQFRILEEITTEDMGIRRMARDIAKPLLHNKYGGMIYTSVGDPAGNQRAQTTETTCLQELAEAGIPTKMARTNEFIARREAVAGFMTRLVDGEPAFLLSPNCDVLRKGFRGKYCYPLLKSGGIEKRYRGGPDKNNPFTHPQDGVQYAAMEAESGGISDFASPESLGSRPVMARSHRGRREVTIHSAKGWD